MSTNRLLELARPLGVDATTAEVVPALQEAGCTAILLRGPVLRRALYGEGAHRPYVDTDLLVSPRDFARAGEVLARLGFSLVLDHRDHGWVADPHAQEWGRAPHGHVDLHWLLPGCTVAGDRSWEILSAHVEPIAVAGIEVQAPTRGALALIVALHAAHHGTTKRRPLDDLDLAVERLGAEAWRAAAALAEDLGATEAFSAGVRLAPAGAALASSLGLADPVSARRRLMAASPRSGALGLLRILEADGGRLEAIRETLFPAPSYMRVAHPNARRGRRGLLLAYVMRLLGRAWRLPAAVLALRAARRAGG
ncbi:MAG TPA: nucleotidyltransferase family protein [Thermoleophilaceae bacterium]|nr:nucleotidyltransferase family protein [Thermoleophilaceae bacterium]